MATLVQTATIARPPQVVWTYISDFPRGPEWIPGQLEKHALTPPPYGVGTRLQTRQKVPGRTVTGTFAVAEWDPPRRLAERSIAGPLAVQVVYALTPAADGTLLRLDYRFWPPV